MAMKSVPVSISILTDTPLIKICFVDAEPKWRAPRNTCVSPALTAAHVLDDTNSKLMHNGQFQNNVGT